MKARCRTGDGTTVGQIGLLLRMDLKSGSSTKKKGMLSGLLKQDDNPFLQPSAQGESSGLSKATTGKSAISYRWVVIVHFFVASHSITDNFMVRIIVRNVR
jgi:hypothetical protein